MILMDEPQTKATRRPLPPKTLDVGATALKPAGNGHTHGAGNGAAAPTVGSVESKRARSPRPTGEAGSVYQPSCPAQKALETIASKWAILIMHRLIEAPMRFSALQRELPGISQKVLTQQLRRLEKFGLVARTVHPTVPPSVEYAITPAGRELKDALQSLCAWATKHADLLGIASATPGETDAAGK